MSALSDEIARARDHLEASQRSLRLVPIEKVGPSVRRAREAQGLTIAELADLVDLSSTTVQQLEQGQGNPRLSTLVTITKALGLKLWVE